MPRPSTTNEPRQPAPDAPDAELHDAIDRLTFDAARRAGAAGLAYPPRQVRRIVTAFDGSEASKHALAWTRELAALFGAKVSLITVQVPPYVSDAMGAPAWWPPIAEDYAHEQAESRAQLDQAFAALRAEGIDGEAVLMAGSPVQEIVRLCRDRQADLVVLGSHSRKAVGRLFLGSVADGVKNHVDASVLITRTPPPVHRILIATDGSSASKRAASWAALIASRWHARATILHVLETPARARTIPEKKVLRETVEELGLVAEGARFSYALDVGAPAEAIVQAALSRECGLVVMGSRGLGAFTSVVAGSVSNRVSHESPVSVLLVKEASA